MGNLSPATQAKHILLAMKALQLMIRGATKQDACADVGISEFQLDNWLAMENEAIEKLQNDIAEAERIRMAQLANAQAIILGSLIDSVTSPLYSDNDMKLKALKYIDKLRNELEQKHGVHTQSDEAQAYAMAGPKTRVEDSKMAVQHELSRSTVNIKTKADGSVDLTIPHQTTIIDVFPELASPDDEDLSSATEEQDDLVS
jgi:hypothetical protein